jgi:hypothetical protein
VQHAACSTLAFTQDRLVCSVRMRSLSQSRVNSPSIKATEEFTRLSDASMFSLVPSPRHCESRLSAFSTVVFVFQPDLGQAAGTVQCRIGLGAVTTPYTRKLPSHCTVRRRYLESSVSTLRQCGYVYSPVTVLNAFGNHALDLSRLLQSTYSSDAVFSSRAILYAAPTVLSKRFWGQTAAFRVSRLTEFICCLPRILHIPHTGTLQSRIRPLFVCSALGLWAKLGQVFPR